jgi:hypothetical protein
VRRLLTLLILVASIAGVVAPATAAAPSASSFTFFLQIEGRPKLTLCVGRKYFYKVTLIAYRNGHPTQSTTIPSVKIQAFSDENTVARFTSPDEFATAYANSDPDPDAYHTVDFELVAGKKPGKTTIHFYVFRPDRTLVHTPLNIRVVDCTFTVSAVADYDINTLLNPGIPYPRLKLSMKTVKVTVSSSATDTQGKIRWTNATYPGKKDKTGPFVCVVHQTFRGKSTVDIAGRLDEDTLVLNFDFATQFGAATETCAGITVPGGAEVTLDPLMIEVGTEGGTYKFVHSYNGGKTKGTFTVTIKPVGQ